MVVLPRWRLCWLREEFGTPGCICKSSVEVPSVGVLGGQVSGLKILLGEGGDVELGARTSKHIFLFAFDRLALNSLSLFYLCIASFILSYLICLCCALHLILLLILYYMLRLFVCASLVLNRESFT